jgi:hypothetical protein
MAKDATINPGDEFTDDTESEAQHALLLSAFPEMQAIDPEAVMVRMATRVHQAESLDDLFDTLTGNSSDHLVGKSYEFTAVTWQPYESERGTVPQAVCSVVDLSTGEATEFVTTGFMLVNFLRRAQVAGWLPFKARIVEKTTKRGQRALNFERV